MPEQFQNGYSRYSRITQFRSGDLLSFRVYIVDNSNRYLNFSKDKLINGQYPVEIESELKNIQISIYGLNPNITLINGQQIINYQQFNSLASVFEFQDLQILGAIQTEGYFSINSTIYANSVNKQPILLSINFRKCKVGEVIQQINSNILICNQCLEGTYQLIDPQILFQQSVTEKSDINRCINCPEYVVKCIGSKIILKNGFWRQNVNTDEIIPCNPQLNSCQAEDPQSINYCSTGYLGPICEQCDILGDIWKGARYSESLSKGSCQICDSKLNQFIYLALKFVIFEIYFLYVLGVFIKKFKHSLTCYYLRKLNIIPISSNSIQDYSGFYIKIILNYYQVSTLLIQKPKIISGNLNLMSDLFGSGGLYLQIGTDCLANESFIRQISKIFFYTLAQFMTPVITLLFIPIALSFYREYTKSKLRKYQFYLLFHIIFIYFQISQIQYFTKTLTCKQVGNHLYNSIDFTVDCYDAKVVKYLYPFSITVLSFWTLFPLILLRVIGQNKKKLDQCLIKYKYGYYYGELKSKYYYWEFVRIYLKIIIIYLHTLLHSNNMHVTILAITLIIGYYIKVISKINPFISINIQQSEIAAYSLILLKIFLQVIYIQNPQTQKAIEIIQIVIDYFYLFCYMVIVIGIMLTNSTSESAIYVKRQLLKIIPSKQFNKLVNFNKVSFQAYMKWRLVYKKFCKSQQQLKTINKKQSTPKTVFNFNRPKIRNDVKKPGLDSLQQFI